SERRVVVQIRRGGGLGGGRFLSGRFGRFLGCGLLGGFLHVFLGGLGRLGSCGARCLAGGGLAGFLGARLELESDLAVLLRHYVRLEFAVGARGNEVGQQV